MHPVVRAAGCALRARGRARTLPQPQGGIPLSTRLRTCPEAASHHGCVRASWWWRAWPGGEGTWPHTASLPGRHGLCCAAAAACVAWRAAAGHCGCVLATAAAWGGGGMGTQQLRAHARAPAACTQVASGPRRSRRRPGCVAGLCVWGGGPCAHACMQPPLHGAPAGVPTALAAPRRLQVIIEKYYNRLTLDFDTNKRVCAEIAVIQTKRLRNKIAGFTTVSAGEGAARQARSAAHGTPATSRPHWARSACTMHRPVCLPSCPAAPHEAHPARPRARHLAEAAGGGAVQASARTRTHARMHARAQQCSTGSTVGRGNSSVARMRCSCYIPAAPAGGGAREAPGLCARGVCPADGHH